MKTFNKCLSTLVVITVLLWKTMPLSAQTFPKIKLAPVVISGLSAPVQVVHANDGTERLFVVQKGGSIKVYDRVTDDQFIDRGVFFQTLDIVTGGEQGLLSLVFDPEFATNRRFYVYHNNSEGNLVVKRYTVDTDNPNRFDPDSETTILEIPHPININHNGGEMHFGPDGYLYLSTGDGGGSGDVPGNAQNTSSHLGKILRFDTNGNFPADNPFPNSPVYAIGLRNPFRWSFDRTTNDIWLGDVGQNSHEEINFISHAALKNANFGWSCYEGNQPFNLQGCPGAETLVFPIHTYPTGNETDRSVIGGVVYRGSAIPSLNGLYIGADHYSASLHLISKTGNTYSVNKESVGFTGIADFGESENGEVYAVGIDPATLYRVTLADPLPVEFVHFGVSESEGIGTLLKWGTVNSENFQHFDLQRSFNGRDFTTLVRIPRKDVNGEPQEYTFEDGDVRSGETYYYRIQIVNNDQTRQYSKIESIVLTFPTRMETEPVVRLVRPNPVATGQLSLLLPDPYEQLEIISSSGQYIGSFGLGGQTGSVQINTSQFPPGIYFARFIGTRKIVTEKVIFR